jgi:NADH:ubiquinone oxidoreductase subunit 6 (subunit J)
MATKKKDQLKTEGEFLFGKKNYLIMIAGAAVILIGFALMLGGGSDDPTIFNEEIYNFRRIRLAPTVVLIGLAIEVYAIMANPGKEKK